MATDPEIPEARPHKLDSFRPMVPGESTSHMPTKPSRNREKVKKGISGLLKKNKFSEHRFRVVLTEQDLIIIDQKLVEKSKRWYREGVEAIFFAGERNYPGAKSTNYLPCVMGSLEAQKKGAHEALLVNEKGNITEGVRSNIFVVKKGRLITPGKDALMGITRNFVLNLAKKIMSVTEKDLKKQDLLKADEIFITQTSSGF